MNCTFLLVIRLKKLIFLFYALFYKVFQHKIKNDDANQRASQKALLQGLKLRESKKN